MNKFYLLILTLLLTFGNGCTTTRQWDSNASKWLLPVNITAAYFGSVGLHELGHGLTAEGFGADNVNIYMLPKTDRNGDAHLALTTYYGEFTDREHTVIRAMGPTAQFLGHVGSRELLKSTLLPRIVQPTVAWFGLFNQVGYYFHVMNGLFGNKATDLGTEEKWISGAMLGGALLYEIYDFFLADKPEKKFLVLFGEDFYEPEPPKEYSFRLLSEPRRGGGFLGLEIRF